MISSAPRVYPEGLFRFSESAAQKAISPRSVRSEACISGRTLNRRATVIDLLDGVLSQIFLQHKIIAGDISSSVLFFVKEKEGNNNEKTVQCRYNRRNGYGRTAFRNAT